MGVVDDDVVVLVVVELFAQVAIRTCARRRIDLQKHLACSRQNKSSG